MMRLLFALLCLSVAGVAGAQETGTLINRGATVGANGRTGTDARGVALGYAACVLGRQPGRVKTMLALPVTDPGYRRMHDSLFQEYSDCLSGGGMSEISFSDIVLRGALYEALYRREFGRAEPQAIAAAAAIDYMAGYTLPLNGGAATTIALARYGDCVARRDPGDVRAIVLSAAGSAQERQGFAGVMPHLGPCLTKGEQLRFSKTVLRGAMAEGLYRVSAAAAAAAPR